jgi:hypothetical protein
MFSEKPFHKDIQPPVSSSGSRNPSNDDVPCDRWWTEVKPSSEFGPKRGAKYPSENRRVGGTGVKL